MNRLAQVAIFLASVLLTLGALELALRLYGWGPDAAAAHARILQFDPAIGWTKIPFGKVVYRWMGTRITETSNSFGGRGPEPASPTGRVLFLGDSFCEGYLVSDDEVFSTVLSKLNPKLTPINLGVAGYSTDQQYLLYQHTGAALNPERVILLFFDNDVWFNSVTTEHRARKPVFSLTPSGLQLTGTPVVPPAQRAAAAPCAECPPSLRLLQLVQQARANVSHSTAQPTRPAIPPELFAYRRSPTPEMENAWQLTAALLQQLRDATANRLTVFYVPTVAAVYDKSWSETKQLFAMDQDWDIHLPETNLTALCARLNIPLISPTSRFRDQAGRGAALYFMQDGHWNAAGHRLAAEIIAANLHSTSR